MEQNELIMQAARLINAASAECALGHPAVANAKLADLHNLLNDNNFDEPLAEPEKPEDTPPT